MFAILVSYARKILAPTVVQVREGIELAGTYIRGQLVGISERMAM